jgi:hypothetical protein
MDIIYEKERKIDSNSNHDSDHKEEDDFDIREKFN